jgi:hypothetical protein
MHFVGGTHERSVAGDGRKRPQLPQRRASHKDF